VTVFHTPSKHTPIKYTAVYFIGYINNNNTTSDRWRWNSWVCVFLFLPL